MTEIDKLQHKFLTSKNLNFNDFALEVFDYQARTNTIYRNYIEALGVNHSSITHLEAIPFIPVEFFKHHEVKSGAWTPSVTYTSSGTTGSISSRHFVYDRDFYLQHALRIFEANYGPVSDYHILALLPSYLEREGSSLVDMADVFIAASKSEHSGFYLYNHDDLRTTLQTLAASTDRGVILLGVSFALLDFAEQGRIPKVPNLIVMETGGMKGRRKEMVREELHETLTSAFGVNSIHSEYGMTEALSQAYSPGNGEYELPWSMKILLRDPNDPLDYSETRERGAINLVDLANIGSCAFLQTSDVGERRANGKVRILGRMDNSDVRGCNLMVQSAL